MKKSSTQAKRLCRGEAGNNTPLPTFWKIGNTGVQLAEMEDNRGVMAILVNALKKKGVRFDKFSFKDGDVTYLNQNIVIFRGATYVVVDRAFQRKPCSFPRKQRWHSGLRGAQLCLAHLIRLLGFIRYPNKVVHDSESKLKS